MKFKDLVEGKKYSNNNGIYTKKDGGLYLASEMYSSRTMMDIMKMDFEEVKGYVGFDEAINYMLLGGIAEFDGTKYKITDCMRVVEPNLCAILTTHIITTSKWVLEGLDENKKSF